MSMVKYDEWRKENPDWDKDWQAGCAMPAEVGDWRNKLDGGWNCLLYTSPSPRDRTRSRMPSSA